MSEYFYTPSEEEQENQNKIVTQNDIAQNEEITPSKKFNIGEYLNKVQDFVLKKWWLILIVVLAFALIFVSVFTYIAFQNQNNNVSDYENVKVSIAGPDTISKGSPDTWKISIENLEDSSLANVVVTLNFDPNFEFIQAESPAPDSPKGNQYTFTKLDAYKQGLYQNIITIKGTSKGNIDEDIIMSGNVSYTPDTLVRLKNAGKLDKNISTKKTLTIDDKRTRTTAAKVSLFMTTRNDIVANNAEAEINLEIENLSEKDIKDLRIRYFYPQGFTYTGSVLSQDNSFTSKKTPDEGNNIWNINNLPRLNKQKIVLNGTVVGAGGISLTFRADLEIRNGDKWESIGTSTRDITLASKPLSISTSIEGGNNLFSAGQALNFVVNYENQGTNSVKDAEIIASVQDPADLLDWSTLQFEGGTRGSNKNKTITWAGNNLPQLANLGIRVQGQLKYSIKLKDSAKFINTIRNQSEYILVPQASASGKNIQPIQVNGETYKAKGDINFTQKITPLPLAEGQINKRRFRVLWELTSKQNEVNLAVVKTRTTLPTNAWISSSITPSANSSQLIYNPSNGDIIWNPGIIPAYSGISKSTVAISFDFEVENTIGLNSDIELYKEISISGKDTFTFETFTKTSEVAKVKFNQ